MSSTAAYLEGLITAKETIRTAITNKGVTCNTSVLLADYHSFIDSISNSGSPSADPWLRPVDWPSLPSVVTGDQKIVGLYAVYDTDANFIAFSVQGNYHVDWGDGVTENHISNDTAQHQYTYSSVSGNTTVDGYKTVVITITPQAGQHLSYASFYIKHSALSSVSRPVVTGWLDITICSSYLTGLQLSLTASVVSMPYLEQVTILDHNLTNLSGLFRSLSRLQSIPLFDTSHVTDMNNMFTDCRKLQNVPLFDASVVLNMNSMFNGCIALEYVPSFSSPIVTDTSYMFSGCSSLVEVSLLETFNVTNMSYMFLGAIALLVFLCL